MSLADLANIPDPNNLNSFHQFSFSDQDSHRKIIAAIFAQKGITLSLYVVDPMPFSDIGQWFAAEYQMHADMNRVTGVAGSDLSYVDFRNPEQWATWIRLHWSEHQQNENILRILG